MKNDTMISKTVTAYGKQVTIACDAKCTKAWGINNRPKKTIQEAESDNDYYFLSDEEITENAPRNPGTYEGGVAKPKNQREQLNKWCFRECERCFYVNGMQSDGTERELTPEEIQTKLTQFNNRVYNIKTSEGKE